MAKRRKKKTRVPRELSRSGALCLAFANTAATRRDNRYSASPAPLKPAGSTIASYDDLVSWGLKMGVLEPGEAETPYPTTYTAHSELDVNDAQRLISNNQRWAE